MEKENCVLEKKEVPNKKKNTRKTIVFGIVFVFAILFVILLIMMMNDSKKENGNSSNSNVDVENYYHYDYEYVLQTFFGQDCYIYLLKDGNVKIVFKTPIYESCEEKNCFNPTGKFEYSEETLSFSEKSMDKVRDFITSFFDKKLTNYVNLEKLDLTLEQKRMELAILLNSEDDITFEEDLIFETKTNQVKNSAGKVIFENEKTTIMASDNKIVASIGQYLNAIVDTEWQRMNNAYLENMRKGIIKDKLESLAVGLKFEELGVYSYSFSYAMQGSVGGAPLKDIKGYVFSSTGEIMEFPNGDKKSIHESAIEEFKKSKEYKEMKENLKGNWEDLLNENMFQTGYWYFKDKKIIFVIPEKLLSNNEMSSNILRIEVDNSDIDF